MERNLIEYYYRLNLTFNEVQNILSLKHDIKLSTRQIKRITASLGLYRRKYKSDFLDVVNYISQELHGPGRYHGYRWMHIKCVDRGLFVDQETVRLIIKCLDPEGVECRSRRRLKRRIYYNQGPNYLWHIDGYDKLKPYGISIHGCIDGFSRNILWLEAYSTNNNPLVVAKYFTDTVSELGGCPLKIRADFGTENGVVQQMQVFLRNSEQNENRAFLYGTSKCNQRIESWWGILRRESAQFWMDIFQTIKDDGDFTGDYLDLNLIRFCFMDLIQKELETVAQTWNNHTIRKTKQGRTPHGKPVTIYNCPELFGTDDMLCEVDDMKIEVCKQECHDLGIPVDNDLYGLCIIEMDERGLHRPDEVEEAIELYLSLRPVIRNLVGQL